MDRENREHCRRIRNFWEEVNSLLKTKDEQAETPTSAMNEHFVSTLSEEEVPAEFKILPPLQALHRRAFELKCVRAWTRTFRTGTMQFEFEVSARIDTLNALFDAFLAQELASLPNGEYLNNLAKPLVCRGWVLKFVDPVVKRERR
jgi:hypothetical protein